MYESNEHFSDKYFADVFTQRVKKDPDRIAYRFLTYNKERDDWDTQDITMRAVYQKALDTAYALKQKNIHRGDRVIIFSMQDYTTVYSVLGCILANVTFTIIPPPIDENKIERFISVLKSCKPKALISNYALEKASGVSLTGRLLKEAFSSAIALKRIWSDRLVTYKRTDVIRRPEPGDIVYLQYTSGSTSAPKGVMVSHRALMAQMDQCDHCGNFHYGKLATWVPFYHNLGLTITILLPILMKHSTAYHLNTLEFLSNPKLWIRMISDFNLNLTVGPNSAYEACTRIFTKEEASQYKISQVTHFMNGSEYTGPDSVKKFIELFDCDPNSMTTGYGLSENVCLASFCARDYRTVRLKYEDYQNGRIVLADESDTDVQEIVSVGAPVKDLRIEIANPNTGKVYPELKVGEIFVAGPSLASGYWGGIAANKNFNRKLKGCPEHFYKTGDLGFKYEGHVYITGRRSEMLIVNGHNVYPSDLMNAVRKKVPVLSYAPILFFAVKLEQKEEIVAVCEAHPEDDFEALAHGINAAIAEQYGFSFYDIVFVPLQFLPRTDNNKLQINKSRELYQAGKLKVYYSSRAYRTARQSVSTELLSRSLNVADDVLEQVQSVFARVLKIENFSLTDSFLELGGNSLMGYELLNSMEEKFHVKLDLREILLDSSVMGITNYVSSKIVGDRTTRKRKDLTAECVLDPSIAVDKPYEKTVQQCSRILLTGATGFLGAHLIGSLIRQHQNEDLRIYCLIRAESEEAAKKRLIKKMKELGCWRESYEKYIWPVCGNLSSERLGVAPSVWKFLSEEIDTVIHNGALLNFVFPYDFLKQTNVNGTIETLRLACEGTPKYYHYVSSYSVYDTPENLGKHVLEDDPLNNAKGFSLAYSETKWVSEKLVNIAKERGLQAVIYRPGDIVGAADGIWAVEDMVSRTITGIIQMKCVPRCTYCMQMTPVDYVGEAIACISRKPEAAGQAFNIVNPQPTSLNRLAAMIRRCGYTLRNIPFVVWRKMLKDADEATNSLVLLECLFEQGTEQNPGFLRHFVGKNTTYDTRNTQLLLNNTGITCPPITTKMVKAYLKYFVKLGVIERP